MLDVVFSKNGEKIGDVDAMAYAEDIVDRAKKSGTTVRIFVANELVIDCFRVLVNEGKIAPYNTEIRFYNLETDPNLTNPIEIDKRGSFRVYPKGFMEIYSSILMRLL